MATIDRAPQRTLAAATGALFVGLFGIGFLISIVLSTTRYPSPFDSAAAIERYFAENRSEERALSLVQTIAAMSLLIFSGYVAALVRRSTDGEGALPWLALAGGIAFSLSLLLRAVHDLAYLAGGPGHVVAFAPFVAAASVAALRSGTLPAWIARLGLIAAVPSLLSALALVSEAAAYSLPLARMVTFAWIGAVSLVLVLGGWTRGQVER